MRYGHRASYSTRGTYFRGNRQTSTNSTISSALLFLVYSNKGSRTTLRASGEAGKTEISPSTWFGLVFGVLGWCGCLLCVCEMIA